MGPYILKERITSYLRNEIKDKLGSEVEDPQNKTIKEYKAALHSVREDIEEKIKEKSSTKVEDQQNKTIAESDKSDLDLISQDNNKKQDS